MSDQQQHRATPEQWAQIARTAEETHGGRGSAALLELLARVQLLEATQHAHIEGLSESDIKAAGLEWARTAPGMRSDDLRQPAGAQVGQSSVAVDQVLALQDLIQKGTLTLAEALKEINGEPEPSADARQLTLVERVQAACDNAPLQHEARPAIRTVAEWLRSEYPQTQDYATAWANLLDNEANTIHA